MLNWLRRNNKASGAVAPTAQTDPVCGMKVEPGTEATSRSVGDNTVLLCSEACAKKFDADPTAYAGPTGKAHGAGCCH